MQANAVLLDGFERIKKVVHATVDGLDEIAMTFRPEGKGNSIAWLIWHLTRIQDNHLADLRKHKQVWIADGWFDKFSLPFDKTDTGYGHGKDDIAKVKTSADLLTGYYDAVHAETVSFIKTLKKDDYQKVVDDKWNPPVTMAVRLISVISDDLQHAGQAAYVRGLLKPGR